MYQPGAHTVIVLTNYYNCFGIVFDFVDCDMYNTIFVWRKLTKNKHSLSKRRICKKTQGKCFSKKTSFLNVPSKQAQP